MEFDHWMVQYAEGTDANGSWFGYCAEEELQAKTFCGQVRKFLDIMDKEGFLKLVVFGYSWAYLWILLDYYEVFPTIYSSISAYTLSVVFLISAGRAYERFCRMFKYPLLPSEESCDDPLPHKQVPKEQPTRYSRW